MTKIIVLHGGVDNSKPQSSAELGEIAPWSYLTTLPEEYREYMKVHSDVWRQMKVCGELSRV